MTDIGQQDAVIAANQAVKSAEEDCKELFSEIEQLEKKVKQLSTDALEASVRAELGESKADLETLDTQLEANREILKRTRERLERREVACRILSEQARAKINQARAALAAELTPKFKDALDDYLAALEFAAGKAPVAIDLLKAFQRNGIELPVGHDLIGPDIEIGFRQKTMHDSAKVFDLARQKGIKFESFQEAA